MGGKYFSNKMSASNFCVCKILVATWQSYMSDKLIVCLSVGISNL